MTAIGMKKKWVGALDVDMAYDNIVSTTLLVDTLAEKKMNDDAWNYFLMACDGKSFDMITLETEINAYGMDTSTAFSC
jgi:hypothetical protein